MKVKDVMTAQVEVLSPNDSIETAARKMKELNVGPMPICEDGKVIGIVTDRDLIVRGVAEGKHPDAKIGEVMTRGVETCSEEDSVEHAAHHMRDKQIRRLIVLGADGKLRGILSLGDLAVESEESLAGETLEGISEPVHPTH